MRRAKEKRISSCSSEAFLFEYLDGTFFFFEESEGRKRP